MKGGRCGVNLAYDFKEKLAVSKGFRSVDDKETIRKLLKGCETVETASPELDRIGVDYIATLRRDAKVYIDVKTRERGYSKHWKAGPEVAIEMWSVMPGGEYNIPTEQARAGWTLDESKVTDMILYIWNQNDSEVAYLLPFQSLRMAARRNIKDWMSKYKVAIQDSKYWESQAVFVPIDDVIRAVTETFAGRQYV